MKVIVRCANNRVTKADMEREIERLFQENKDLRLSESHLRDEVNILRQQSEVNELEKQLEWVRDKNEEWAAVAQGLRNTIEELKAQKEADDKKSEEICTACNERYEEVLSERNRLREEVARLTTERDTSVSENSELIFTINELQDKLEVERNLRVEAEKAYDKVASEAYDMHQQITDLIIDNTRLKNKVEELSELEADYDALSQAKQEYGEEIDRLRRAVIELLIASLPMNSLA